MAGLGRPLPPGLDNVLNDYLGIGQPPPSVASGVQPQNEQQQQQQPSIILDIPDNEGQDRGLNNETEPEAAQGSQDGQRPEWVLVWKLVWRYAPFLLLLFAKLMYEHRLGFLCLLGFYGTFYYANSSLKKSISTRDISNRDGLKLLIIPVYLLLNTLLVYYVFDKEQLYRSLVFLSPVVERYDLSTLLWVVCVTDFIIRFLSISLKAVVAAAPRFVIPLKSKGKYYMMIEHLTQYYRRLTPIVPWFYFLTDTPSGSGVWFSYVLCALYAIFKLRSCFIKSKELLGVFKKCMSSTTYGVKPSHGDMSTLTEGCPICQDDYVHPIMLNCKHIFCEDCVSLWFDREQTCPMCRAKAVNDAPSWRDGSTTPFIQLF